MTTGGRQVLAACSIVFCHLQRAARRSATEPPRREVTSPQAMAPCAACAPSGRDKLPDARLELDRPDHADLETEVAQGGTQVVLDGNGLGQSTGRALLSRLCLRQSFMRDGHLMNYFNCFYQVRSLALIQKIAILGDQNFGGFSHVHSNRS